jgi:hypothetical protein
MSLVGAYIPLRRHMSLWHILCFSSTYTSLIHPVLLPVLFCIGRVHPFRPGLLFAAIPVAHDHTQLPQILCLEIPPDLTIQAARPACYRICTYHIPSLPEPEATTRLAPARSSVVDSQSRSRGGEHSSTSLGNNSEPPVRCPLDPQGAARRLPPLSRRW